MKIEKPFSPDELVILDLLKPSTLSPEVWVKAISFEINEPPTVYVRVANGRYAVRVISNFDTEVILHVDGRKMLESKVGKGIHIFDRDEKGRLFHFGENESAAGDVLEPVLEPVQQTLFGSKEELPCVRTRGLVVVHVRFCDRETGSPRASITPDYQQPVFFQMNPPGAHEEVCASLLSKIKAPPKLSASEDIFGEYERLDRFPQRHCCNCPDERTD